MTETAAIACSYTLRVWQKVIPGNVYAIGGDPAEGLQHGDDSVLECLNCTTGKQVAELAGKIEPFAFAELASLLGLYYNKARVGIENNRDGGANKQLFELGYPNIHFEMKDRGEASDQATPKLGVNMNIRTRHRYIMQAVRFAEDGSARVASQWLVRQMETFVLRDAKFQATPGGHDDYVMAYVIACEMMRYQWLFMDINDNPLLPTVEGETFTGDDDEEYGDADPFGDEAASGDEELPLRSDRLIQQAGAKRLNEPSTMGNLI